MEVIIFLLVILIFFVATSVRIMKEYERGVVYTLGRYTHTTGPGLIILIPFVQSMTTVDLRVRTEDVPSQDVISKDNISVRVSAVMYYRVVEPGNAINKVEDFIQARVSQIMILLHLNPRLQEKILTLNNGPNFGADH